jgi:hypothetical protein
MSTTCAEELHAEKKPMDLEIYSMEKTNPSCEHVWTRMCPTTHIDAAVKQQPLTFIATNCFHGFLYVSPIFLPQGMQGWHNHSTNFVLGATCLPDMATNAQVAMSHGKLQHQHAYP